MRALAVFVFVLAGCDLQPPPKKQAPTAQRPGNVTPPAAGSGSGVAKPPAPPPAPKPPAEATPPAPPTPGSAAANPGAGSGGAPSCLEVATTIAELLVRTSKDASEKAANEQSRTQLVKSLSDGCTKAAWSEEARNCYMKATERAHLESCGKLVRPKAPAADNPAGN